MEWLAIFLAVSSVGLLSMTALVPRPAIGNYFWKFHANVALILNVLAVVIAVQVAGPVAMITLLGVQAFGVFLFSVLLRLPALIESRWIARFPLLFLVVPAVLAFPVAYTEDAFLLLVAHGVSSAILLGSSVVAMILGHWYLVNAKLSFEYLIRMCRIFLWAVLGRTVVAVISAAVGFSDIRPLLLGTFDGLLIGTRWGAGLFGVGILAWMALSCARMKSNQSATGILYVALFFVLVGELISAYWTWGRGLAV